ncbi:MAG: ribosome biogenesis protein [Lachnospiraceae bacterium]|nr:ribosome biogenesis protein [Lachnospiraceae bacterium]
MNKRIRKKKQKQAVTALLEVAAEIRCTFSDFVESEQKRLIAECITLYGQHRARQGKEEELEQKI